MNVVEGKWISILLGNVMLQNFFGLCFTCESWDTKLEERVDALPCEASLELLFQFTVCGPFAAREAKGGKGTPKVD